MEALVPLTSWELEAINLALNLVCVGVIFFLALKARLLYFSIRTELTSIGDAARQVRELIAQNEALIQENRRLWASYSAAAADAEAQRLRFLRHSAEDRAHEADAAEGGEGAHD